MSKITISDLSPSDGGKFINEVTTWEMNTVYAGMERRFGGRRRQAEPNSQEVTTSITDANATLDRWLGNLEVQIQDLRTQMGISQ